MSRRWVAINQYLLSRKDGIKHNSGLGFLNPTLPPDTARARLGVGYSHHQAACLLRQKTCSISELFRVFAVADGRAQHLLQAFLTRRRHALPPDAKKMR